VVFFAVSVPRGFQGIVTHWLALSDPELQQMSSHRSLAVSVTSMGLQVAVCFSPFFGSRQLARLVFRLRGGGQDTATL
jgi:hypothetical protein